MLLEGLISTLAGTIIPKAFNFIEKKFLKGSDDPEETMATLAIQNPDALAAYTKSRAELLLAEVQFFKRDVDGELPTWVKALRASIRPIGTIVCILGLIFSVPLSLSQNVIDSFGVIVGLWFGTRK